MNYTDSGATADHRVCGELQPQPPACLAAPLDDGAEARLFTARGVKSRRLRPLDDGAEARRCEASRCQLGGRGTRDFGHSGHSGRAAAAAAAASPQRQQRPHPRRAPAGVLHLSQAFLPGGVEPGAVRRRRHEQCAARGQLQRVGEAESAVAQKHHHRVGLEARSMVDSE